MAITRACLASFLLRLFGFCTRRKEKNFLNSCPNCDKYKTAPQNSLLHNRSLPRIVPAAAVLWDAFAACSSFSQSPAAALLHCKKTLCLCTDYIREFFFSPRAQQSSAALRRRHFVACSLYGRSIWNWVWGPGLKSLNSTVPLQSRSRRTIF